MANGSTTPADGQATAIGVRDGNGMGTYVYSLQRLQKRAFGGEDVAARPGSEDDDWWPKGPLLPGIKELTDDFVEGLTKPHALRLVFLLGGAGNGKSFAARALGGELGLERYPADALAHRIYRRNRAGTQVAILNDATIAPSNEYHSRQDVALATDIQGWWTESASQPIAAFCCVNRGIVIDELRAIANRGEEVGPFARAVLEWLASSSVDLARGVGGVSINEAGRVPIPHCHEVEFTLEGRTVRISALSVDLYSLMDAEGTQSRAGVLFKQVVELCREEAIARPDNCPIKANVMQWLSPDAIHRWEGVLSHAEVASGRLYSYRDVWGLAALTILGSRHSTNDGTRTLLEHIDQGLHAAGSADSPHERINALLELAHYRSHNALFRSPCPSGKDASPRYPPTTPAHAGLSLVDPSLWGSTTGREVEAAMQGIAVGSLPSAALRQMGLLSEGTWFPFDRDLEEAIVGFVSSDDCPSTVRRRLISWLGGYIIRLVGVSTSDLGNSGVVNNWKQCYDRTSKGTASLPLELEHAIRSLIFPRQGSMQDKILVPAFAARVEPLQISRDGMGPKLAEVISHNAITLQLRRQGSRLMVDCLLAGHNDAIGQLVLDFPLLREALACRGHRSGQTESTAHIEPRIERCRAACLAAIPAPQHQLVVASGGKLLELHR